MLQRVRTNVRNALSVAVDGALFLGSTGGAAVAVAFGKVLLAVALGAFAFAVFLRLSSRRRAAFPPEARMPRWSAPAVALTTIAECAAMVEAVDLPVRMSQPGFQYYHWLFVLAFLVVAYSVQCKLLRWSVTTRQVRSTGNAP